MSPERQVFKRIEEYIANPDGTPKEDLKKIAIRAFYLDHPEVRMLFTGVKPFDVNFYGEHPAYKYNHLELGDEHSKLKKCLEIMEDLFERLG